jgi:tetratricopeptide (TPR) repeat protein
MKQSQMIIGGAVALLYIPLLISSWKGVARDHQAEGLRSLHLQRANVAYDKGEFSKSLYGYQRALVLRPTDSDLVFKVMKVRASILADNPSSVSKEATASLQYELEILIDKDPANAATYHTGLGHIYMAARERAKGKEEYEKALKADGDNFFANSAMGQFQLEEKEGKSVAKVHFERVLEQRPAHVGALIGLARIAMSEKGYEDAIARMTTALDKNEYTSARMLRAKAYALDKKYDEAAADYREVLLRNPKDPTALLSLGETLLAAKKPKEAEPVLRAAAQVRGDTSSVQTLGFALQQQDKSKEALSMFLEVLKANQNDVMAIFGAASALENLGKNKDAINLYARLLKYTAPEGQELDQGMVDMQKNAKARMDALVGAKKKKK